MEDKRNIVEFKPMEENHQKEINEVNHQLEVDNRTIEEVLNTVHGDELVKLLKTINKRYLHLMTKRINKKEIDKMSLQGKTEFYQLRELGEEIFKNDNKSAKMIDVDRAVTVAYTILVKMIKVLQDDIEKMQGRINELESKCGLEQTDWIVSSLQSEDKQE